MCRLAHYALSHVMMAVILIALSAKADAGRHSAAFALGGFESASGWTPGWSFFIGLLPVSDSLFRVNDRNEFMCLSDVDI